MKLLKKKSDLREACLKKYGEDFIKLYDLLANGVPIGDFVETANILYMIDIVKEEEKRRTKLMIFRRWRHE